MIRRALLSTYSWIVTVIATALVLSYVLGLWR